MKNIILLLGVLWIAIGTLTVFVVDFARKKIFDKILKADYKKLSPIPIVVGILLLLTAGTSKWPLFIVILGLLSISKGLFIIFGSQSKINSITDRWKKAGKTTYRIFGIVLIGLGILVLMSIT